MQDMGEVFEAMDRVTEELKGIKQDSYKMRQLRAQNRAWQEDVDRKWREVERLTTPVPRKSSK